jgi:hypothetical protein
MYRFANTGLSPDMLPSGYRLFVLCIVGIVLRSMFVACSVSTLETRKLFAFQLTTGISKKPIDVFSYYHWQALIIILKNTCLTLEDMLFSFYNWWSRHLDLPEVMPVASYPLTEARFTRQEIAVRVYTPPYINVKLRFRKIHQQLFALKVGEFIFINSWVFSCAPICQYNECWANRRFFILTYLGILNPILKTKMHLPRSECRASWQLNRDPPKCKHGQNPTPENHAKLLFTIGIPGQHTVSKYKSLVHTCMSSIWYLFHVEPNLSLFHFNLTWKTVYYPFLSAIYLDLVSYLMEPTAILDR